MKIAFVAFLIAAFVSTIARGAVTEIGQEQYNTTFKAGSLAWSLRIEAGFPSSIPEIYFTRTNGSTVTANHVWSEPEQFGLSQDEAGNLTSRLGSTVLTIQPTLNFNTILVRIQDFAFFGGTGVQNLRLDGTNYGSFMVDNNNSDQRAFRYLLIDGFNPEFDVGAALTKSAFSGSNDSTWEFVGVLIPEPSTMLLALLGAVISMRRRR